MSTPDRDILISRVVEGRANSEDWSAVDTLAASDASLWRDIVHSHRDEQNLRRVVNAAGAAAEAVDLPAALTVHTPSSTSFSRRPLRIGALGGWLVAAAIGLAFVQSRSNNTELLSGKTDGSNASLLPTGFKSADDAYKAYLTQGQKEGRVVGEVPEHYVLESTPAADGPGYNVTFVRFIVERQRVASVVRPTQDETGALRALPFTMIVQANPGTAKADSNQTSPNKSDAAGSARPAKKNANPAKSWD